ncbi:MAG: hypothetical protein ACPGLV_02105 [Bacteroidia bacterium]
MSCKKENEKCIIPTNNEGLTHGMCSCYWDNDKKYLRFRKQYYNGNWINEYVCYGFNGSTVIQYSFLDTNSATVFSAGVMVKTLEYKNDSVFYIGNDDRFIQLIPHQKNEKRLLKIYVANPPNSNYQVFVIHENQVADTFSRTSIPYINRWELNDSLIESDSIIFEIHSTKYRSKLKHIERYKSSVIDPFIPGFPFKEDHVTPNISSGRQIKID